MNSRSLAGLSVVLLGIAASLAFAFLGSDRDPTGPTPTPPPATTPEPAANEGTPNPAVAAENASEVDRRIALPESGRSEIPRPQFAQGLRGLVLDAAARPLAGRQVYLVDSAGNEPLALPLLRQQRDAFGPVASCNTEADGSFAVGLPVAQDRIYELYVVSPNHATARLGGLRLLPGQWHQIDTITMTAGATLRGRVTVAGRDDIPVPAATVQVEIGTAFADAALRALPGADVGLVTTVDAAGNYELRNVPSRGIVQVAAVAPGFARLQKGNIELALDKPVVVDFGLLPGHSIAGSVVNVAGEPLANAMIEAWPKDATQAPLTARCDDQGRFTMLGLAACPHRVRAQARNHRVHDEATVEPGRTDLRFVLNELSRVRVRVQAPNGDVVRSYQLALRRVFPEQPAQIGNVATVPDQRVRLDANTDAAELAGVPEGWFACQVEAEGFAKTLSQPFDNTRSDGDQRPRQFEVVMTMALGATVRGRVVDENGEALAGAVVTTQADGRLPDSPFQRMLAGTLPERTTAARATTGPDGAFVLRHLAHADYQLQIEHPDACRTLVGGLQLLADGDRELPPICMPGGAMIRGTITVQGRVAGQVKIVFSTPADHADARTSLRLETVTEANGTFALPRRVPVGRYEVRAAVMGKGEPESQIFREILQLQRSATTVTVAPGQGQVECVIDLPSDH